MEISKSALIHNIKAFRDLVGKDVVLAPTVKANAYGHGLIDCAKEFIKAGVDYLCVNALFEARQLRDAGIKISILIIGYTPLSDLEAAIQLKCDFVVYNFETIKKVGTIGRRANVHLKIETGNHRQGIRLEDIGVASDMLNKYMNINVAGVSTHFANLEDKINHHYAIYQLKRFKKAIKIIKEGGHTPHYIHCANSAATILLPEAHFNFVRLGISVYGLWTSEKTEKAAIKAGINMALKPALTWKSVIAQVKDIKKGALVGYGCTYEMSKNGKIAVIPIGYYDGYVRAMSNKGYVLIKGNKVPVIGRVCMNMIMVDISDIPNVKLEDEVVLLGSQKTARITAENIGIWSNTINYEVTTRINERIPRIFL